VRFPQADVRLAVDRDQFEGVFLVLVRGQAVAAGGLQAGVAEDLGDQDQVGLAADQGGGERVAQDVRGGGVVEAGRLGDRGDDAAGGACGQPSALGVEEQGSVVAGVGPVGALVEPELQLGAELGVDVDLAELAALAVQAQLALAG
jgi:hypothetical protein